MIKKLNKKQKEMKKIIERFQKYVQTYNKNNMDCNNSIDTYIKDMIYGIGISIKPTDYEWNDGFNKFLDYIKTIINKEYY